MKNLFLCFMLCLPTLMVGQTLDLEKKALFEKISKEDIPNKRVNEMSKGLVELFAKYKDYPALPYSSDTDMMDFSQVYNLPGMSKDDIFEQVKEWIAINYGSIDAVLHYENKQKGKIIAKGFFSITTDTRFRNLWGKSKSTTMEIDIYHTAIFSIKDGKLKIEFVKLNYKYMTGGYHNGSYYTPLEEQRYSLASTYPVVLGDYSQWEFLLSTLHETSAEVELTMKLLSEYLKDKGRDDF